MSISSVKTGAIGVSLLAGNDFYTPYVYQSIATASLSSTQATITFSSIPSTYKHLQIRTMGLTNRGTYGYDGMTFTFNGDTAMNYATHGLNGNGAGVSASGIGTGTYNYIYFDFANGTTVNNYPGCSIIDILDYANTNKYKTVRALGGADLNGTIASVPGRINYISGLWLSTNAITSITFTPVNNSFVQYSHFALYGIKG